MARPFKSGVDYFPLDVVVDDKVKILEAEHGLIGFGVWVKLQQKVYSSNYWVNWDKKAKIIFSNEVNVDINSVNDIINSCMEWEIFDRKIFEKYFVLTSRGIQKRYFKICEKRLRIEVIKEYLLIEVPIIEKQEIVIVDINPVNSVISTQSKVNRKEIKEVRESPLSDPDKFIKNMPIWITEKWSGDQVKDKTESLIDYCNSKGKVYKDYYSALRNYLKKDYPDGKTTHSSYFENL